MKKVNIQGHDFYLTIDKKNISSIRLKLVDKKHIKISAPIFTPSFFINSFIANHADWIIAQSKKIKNKSLKSLKNIKILDNNFKIVYNKTQNDSVIIDENEQTIYINTPSLSNIYLRQLIDKKFRPFALSLIKENLKKLAQEYNFSYNSVTVRNQSSRFGSCSSRRNLNFNWQIIFFPYPIFRHLLLHELTHLDIKNHQKEFWQRLSSYDLDFKKHNKFLKTRHHDFLLF
jgi:predicted metal-dependent hydrolase